MATNAPENYIFVKVEPESSTTLSNLLELYCHDMSEWLDDVDTDQEGSFKNNINVHACWEDGKSVFFAKRGELPIGFAIVQPDPELNSRLDWDLKEFFILRKHRGQGLSRSFAKHVWNEFPGKWKVRVHANNLPGVPFWRRTIDQHSNGNFVEDLHDSWLHFSFDQD